MERRPALRYHIYRGGGVREGGEGKEGREREQICPCTKCSHVHVDSTLSLFLISPFCCCSLSRYKKVLQERYTPLSGEAGSAAHGLG
jgi:hypothetical protein